VLLALYSYFMTVELRPDELTVCEVFVWVWAITLWFEELRQVCFRQLILMLAFVSSFYATFHKAVNRRKICYSKNTYAPD